MSAPTERHPGAYYHIARRCHRREFRLRPCADLNGAITVLIHDACEKTRVQVIAFAWMSDHYHLVVYDPAGRLSEWLARVNGVVARYCNAVQGTSSHVWDAQELKEQELGDIETVAHMTAYVIANPVAAGLVYAPSAWPGLCSTLKEIGTGRGPVHVRPKHFFRPNGAVSRSGTIAHACPPDVTPARFRKMVGKALAPLLEKARAKVDEIGRGFVGAEQVQAADPFERAKGPDPRRSKVGSAAKGFRKMLAATKAKVEAMLERRHDFIRRYAEARRRRLGGEPSTAVVFPAGTWRQWCYHGALREPPLDMNAAT